ncbi:hypothetical protein PFMC_00894 [Plasmodium falciparum CAMP/Malaysia]|uniref:Uncharacterized protein n=1 Tax=Plasmodium falciparum (isolate Camp / Malaysia) TaxID=5835 RepID=A0A024XDH6_PLAFC|nr:hypothetical protein PFMC_00894 [Plasmodium falciparum CAMP/Malaysia]
MNILYIYIIKEGRNMFNNIIYNHTMLLQPHLYGITKSGYIKIEFLLRTNI